MEDLERRRQIFDRLNDQLEDIEVVVTQGETSLSDISQSTSVTESQRLQRLQVTSRLIHSVSDVSDHLKSYLSIFVQLLSLLTTICH